MNKLRGNSSEEKILGSMQSMYSMFLHTPGVKEGTNVVSQRRGGGGGQVVVGNLNFTHTHTHTHTHTPKEKKKRETKIIDGWFAT